MRNKRKKFVELAEARVNRTVKFIRLIGNLSNRNSYEYSETDVREIFKALQKEIDSAKSRFSKNGEGGNDAFRLSNR